MTSTLPCTTQNTVAQHVPNSVRSLAALILVGITGWLAAASVAQATPPLRADVPSSHFVQRQPNSCGLAAIAYLRSTLEHTSIAESELAGQIYGRYRHSGGEPPAAGYSLADLHWLLRKANYSPVAVRASLDTIHLPAVLWLPRPAPAHFVVLEKIDHERVKVFDPAVGGSWMSREALLSRWLTSGAAGLALQPGPPPGA